MRSFSSAERLVAAFDELVDAALALYKDERLFQAAEIVLVLRAGVAAFADADDRVGKLGARLDENENIVLIEDRSVLLKEMWADMVQEDKWTLVKDSGSIKTSYHHVEVTKSYPPVSPRARRLTKAFHTGSPDPLAPARGRCRRVDRRADWRHFRD